MEGKREKDDLILSHQLEEWKYLNEYINNMDLGYQQSIVGVTAVFGIIATVLTVVDPEVIQWGFFIIPLGLVAVFSYMSYQFRITAILRGHLAALEKKMNNKLGENIHMWNSALMETFMAHNNPINNAMMYPVLSFVVLLIGYSGYITWMLLQSVKNGMIVFAIYWTVVVLGIVIVFPPFLFNERIRHATEDEERVLEEYKKYLDKRKVVNDYKELNKGRK